MRRIAIESPAAQESVKQEVLELKAVPRVTERPQPHLKQAEQTPKP